MKRELLPLLACPLCKGPLHLEVEQEEAGEVLTGGLHCPRCQETYPIRDALPSLVPPELQSPPLTQAS